MRQTSKNVSPMSNEGRNLYVITHITESLLELLKDKPLMIFPSASCAATLRLDEQPFTVILK